MFDFLKDALARIPEAAKSPLSLIAYLAAVIAWVLVALKTARMKSLLQHLADIPRADRLKAIKAEMGTVNIREGLSPKQWLQSKVHMYYFIGFLTLCLVVVVVLLVAAYVSIHGRDTPAVSSTAFGFKVVVHEASGPHDCPGDIPPGSAVTVDFDDRRDKQELVQCQAFFHQVPAAFRGKEVLLGLHADGYKLREPSKRYRIGDSAVVYAEIHRMPVNVKALDPRQIKLKVFNFANYSEAAKASHIGERFSGLILDQLVKLDMQSRADFIDTLLERSLHIFMYRGGPPAEDIAYLNELAPAVLVQGYVEDAAAQSDFRAHTRVNFIDRRVTTYELGNMLKRDDRGRLDIAISPLFAETVDFSIGDMERHAKDQATEIYASILASWAELANESERLISHLKSNDPSDYLKAGAELILCGMSAVPQLLEAVDASEGAGKARIVLVLGEMRLGKLLPVYQRLLVDPSSDVVLACLSAIRKLSDGSRTP